MDAARLATAGIASCLLLAGIWTAAARGLGDAHSLVGRELLAKASREASVLAADELPAARASLLAAHALEPSNPLFIELLARLDDMAARVEQAPKAREAALRQALQGFRHAVHLRPASPFAWAGLAAVKLRLDEMDYEFYGAIERADRYGAWEPAVQLALADIGLAGWRLLAQPAKRIVAGAIARGLGREGKQLRALATRHGTLASFCADERRLGAPTGLCPGH